MTLLNQPNSQGHSISNSLSPLTLGDDEFNFLRKYIYDQLGISLTDQKRSLIAGRLQKFIKDKGLMDFKGFCQYLANDKTGFAVSELANRVTTNHTFFFREADHFDFLSTEALKNVVEQHKKNSDYDLRIWCAGCSSGEEAYVLAMLIFEFFGHEHSKWNIGVLATDISEKALNTAQLGVYNAERMQEVPVNLRKKYFEPQSNGDWKAKDMMRNEITFRRFNLMNEQFPFKKPFDIIFCRNVMIYFDQVTREALVKRFYAKTQPGGYLFIGHSESLSKQSCPYQYVRSATYYKGK